MEPFAATTPLPESERGNFEGEHISQTHVTDKSVRMLDPDFRARLKEGQRAAVPKSEYGNALARFCVQCTGKNPAMTDCEAEHDCKLYPINTRDKRRKVTKARLRSSIAEECRFCTAGNPDSCTSPACELYRFRRVKDRGKIAQIGREEAK